MSSFNQLGCHMNENEILVLLEKYHNNECTPEEKAFLEAWFSQHNAKTSIPYSNADIERDLQSVSNLLFPVKARMVTFVRIAAAAAILVLSVGIYLMLQTKETGKQVSSIQQPSSKSSDTAIYLILSNGDRIPIESSNDGILAVDGGSSVKKVEDDMIVYDDNSTLNSSSALYNTISTPVGKHFKIQLPDGSKVWLNALSSIKFPTTFSASERKVSITGEVFFEVLHNPKQPFKVDAGGYLIEDLGTSFNVNSYSDEPFVKTTLVSGVVEVYLKDKKAVLAPGQQSAISRNSVKQEILVTRDIDLGAVTGWKDGFFRFNKTDLADVLRQFSRWYNLEIQYANGDVPAMELSGEISRNSSLNSVFQLLEFYKVKFTVEKKKDDQTIVKISK